MKRRLLSYTLLGCMLACSLACMFGCKTPDQIEQETESRKPAQEIVIKQELARDIRTLAVTGVGTASVSPDIVEIQLILETQPVPIDSLEETYNEQIGDLQAIIQATGISPTDLTIQSPTFEPPAAVAEGEDVNANASAKQQHDTASHSAIAIVSIRTKRIQSAPALMREIMDLETVRVSYLEYRLQDENAAYQQALTMALKDAQEKAAQMAGTLGVDLDGPGIVTETTNFQENMENLHNGGISEAKTVDETGSETLQSPPNSELLLATPGIILVSSQISVNYHIKYPARTPAPLPTDE